MLQTQPFDCPRTSLQIGNGRSDFEHREPSGKMFWISSSAWFLMFFLCLMSVLHWIICHPLFLSCRVLTESSPDQIFHPIQIWQLTFMDYLPKSLIDFNIFRCTQIISFVLHRDSPVSDDCSEDDSTTMPKRSSIRSRSFWFICGENRGISEPKILCP
jgi:hypothetical protein